MFLSCKYPANLPFLSNKGKMCLIRTQSRRQYAFNRELSVTNDDSGGKENVKKARGLIISKTTIVHVQHTVWYNSLSVPVRFSQSNQFHRLPYCRTCIILRRSGPFFNYLSFLISPRKHPFLLALRRRGRFPSAKSEEKRMFSQAIF